MCSRSETSGISMMWQNRMMKRMKGDWVMVLDRPVRIIWSTTKRGIVENQPVDVCFQEHRLPSRLCYHRNASVVFLKGISGGINAFLTKCGHRWAPRGNAPVDERKHRKADDSIGTFCNFVVIRSENLPFARLVMVLWPVSRQHSLEGRLGQLHHPKQVFGTNSRGCLAHIAWQFLTPTQEPGHETPGCTQAA